MLELIKKSRSYRSFNKSRPVTEAELLALVECARFTPAAMNRQFLRYRLCYTEGDMGALLSCTKWAAALPDWKLPPEGHEPPAAIVICHDTSLAEDSRVSARDVGIAAQTMLLSAAEQGLGGCMIANFSPEKLAAALHLPEGMLPVLVIPFGEPDEEIVLEDVQGGNTAYYRDEKGVHHVPKRTMDELIIR